ncbi:sporulation protein [Streptomyces durbertensis]|uniref:Sporulation protein n=1 Tax=Streptomyces durbertensis TaxID=2448886 RepID=A0ABR6EEV2_9ACTN|nr:sporulation protein [Streptomyces durbertensis]MBB1243852.1 sporulation protein [Streptomyces durbertensis]
MVLRRLLGSIGIGGPSVDTVLQPEAARPGDTLSGEIHLTGGGADFEIEHLTLELVARVEAEHEQGESEGMVAFERFTVAGGFRLAREERRTVPFSVTLPHETPLTQVHGQDIGVVLGVRTELGIAGARDKGDMDPLTVRPLPAQEAILTAFGRLGFGFRSADLEYGHVGGTRQQLPFYQEIELTPPPRRAHQVDEVEVTFLARPDGMEVVLEAGGHSGLTSAGHDALNRFDISHAQVPTTDWDLEVDSWLGQLIDRRSAVGGYGGYVDGAPYAHKDDGPGDHRSGPGVGTAIAAGAAGLAVGVAGGLVAAEVVDEVGDFLEGDDEEDDA